MLNLFINRKTIIGFLLVMESCSVVAGALADHARVGVIRPEVRKPYKIIFDDINNGLIDAIGNTPIQLYINAKTKRIDIDNWVKSTGIDYLVTLGQASTKSVKDISVSVTTVSGALVSLPDQSKIAQGVALTPRPIDLFRNLKRLQMKIKRVAVVYNPNKYQWLIDLAEVHASSIGIELQAYQASDIKESVNIHTRLLSNNNSDSLAIWLLQDRSTVDNKVVLPFLLEKTWHKSMIIFSNSIAHVKKGVLFCMYPNNRKHGQQLGELLIDISHSRADVDPGLKPTFNSSAAINTRTAEHLGIKLTNSELQDFDVIFPMPN